MTTVVEAAAAEHFSPEGSAPVPLRVPDAVMPLACAAEFDTVYVGVTAFTYIVRAARHVVRNGFDETGGFPVTESPATPDRMSAVELLAARSAVLGTL
ncbi:hypothetical protein [Amycolatopsis sp. NPDC021455]|uniref:hypothetical protein n=1 Tax=Amycolatopsis sp. NPDC021455 TaxID=3154901 RepID=UPI00340CAC1A